MQKFSFENKFCFSLVIIGNFELENILLIRIRDCEMQASILFTSWLFPIKSKSHLLYLIHFKNTVFSYTSNNRNCSAIRHVSHASTSTSRVRAGWVKWWIMFFKTYPNKCLWAHLLVQYILYNFPLQPVV